MARKSYVEKLSDTKDLPKIVQLDQKGRERFGGKTMVIPRPTDVYAIMQRVPQGRLITTSEIRSLLARQYHVDVACPLTTGIFVNVSAHASEQLDDDLPWWRTLKSAGELNPKFPHAPDEQIARLEKEGFEIVRKGKKNIRYFVRNYQSYLIDIFESPD